MKKRKLNEKEIEVLKLTAQGCTDIEIGETLHISPGYVRRILEALYNKSDAVNKANLVSWGYENKVLGA